VRLLVFLAASLFILGFALLTALDINSNGVTFVGIVGILILVVIGVGVLGALVHPPRR
jgi:heme A synthase